MRSLAEHLIRSVNSSRRAGQSGWREKVERTALWVKQRRLSAETPPLFIFHLPRLENRCRMTGDLATRRGSSEQPPDVLWIFQAQGFLVGERTNSTECSLSLSVCSTHAWGSWSRQNDKRRKMKITETLLVVARTKFYSWSDAGRSWRWRGAIKL